MSNGFDEADQFDFEAYLLQAGRIQLLAVFQAAGVLRSDAELYLVEDLLEQLKLSARLKPFVLLLLRILAKAGFIEMQHENLVSSSLVENPALLDNLKQSKRFYRSDAELFPQAANVFASQYAALEQIGRLLQGQPLQDQSLTAAPVTANSHWQLAGT